MKPPRRVRFELRILFALFQKQKRGVPKRLRSSAHTLYDISITFNVFSQYVFMFFRSTSPNREVKRASPPIFGECYGCDWVPFRNSFSIAARKSSKLASRRSARNASSCCSPASARRSSSRAASRRNSPLTLAAAPLIACALLRAPSESPFFSVARSWRIWLGISIQKSSRILCASSLSSSRRS